MASLAKQHRGPASSTKAVAGEPPVLQYGMSCLTKRDPSCGCHEKRSCSTDRVSLAAHPLSGRQITSKNEWRKVASYKVVHGPLNAESTMLQSSWHLPPASKGHPQDAGTLHMGCGRTGGRRGLVSCPTGRQPLTKNTALLVPLSAANLQPGAGSKNAAENGQKRVFTCPPFRWLIPVDPMGKK